MYQLLLILLAVFSSRVPHPELRLHECWPFARDDPRAEAKLSHAEYLFRARNYTTAGRMFRDLAGNYGNTAVLAERARFMQAECLRLRGNFVGAEEAYHQLLNDFPTGGHRSASCARLFEIGMDWLDDFRDEVLPRENPARRWRFRYPHKPLVNKERRAIEVLSLVPLHDVLGPHSDEAYYWCGYVSFARGDYEKAVSYLGRLVELYEHSRFYGGASDLLDQAREKLESKETEVRLRLVRRPGRSAGELADDPWRRRGRTNRPGHPGRRPHSPGRRGATASAPNASRVTHTPNHPNPFHTFLSTEPLSWHV